MVSTCTAIATPLLFVALVTAQCPGEVARNETEVKKLVDSIKESPFPDDQLKALEAGLKGTSLGFNSSDVRKLIDLFVYGNVRTQALNILQPFVLGLTTDDEVSLVKGATFPDDQLKTLNLTCDLIVTDDKEATAKKIIEAFIYDSWMKKANATLQNCQPRSCTYGTITAKKVHFVVDTSGSMGGTFTTPEGTLVTRLAYVQKELDEVIEEQLPKMQGREFNLFRYSSDFNAWSPGLQPCTSEKLASAVQYVSGWRVGGGTDTYTALQKAYAEKDVEAVYLLSDGMPQGSIPGIIAAAKGWCQEGKIPLNTVALIAGGSESPSQKNDATNFMKQLADVCGGIFRGIGEKTQQDTLYVV